VGLAGGPDVVDDPGAFPVCRAGDPLVGELGVGPDPAAAFPADPDGPPPAPED
jgi:hypothetical protein